MALNFSLSAYKAWQRCEQNYEYSYVRRLRPIVRDLAPQRGIIIHEWLAEFYRQLQGGKSAEEARTLALTTIQEQKPKIDAAKTTAFLAGDHELAQEYDDLLPSVVRILGRYYHVRGKHDAQKYDVLMVEETVRVRIAPATVSTSIIDLVLRDRQTGVVWLVEHKSSGNIPDSSVRLRDFQTLLYATVLEQTRGIHVDGVLWNYLRTKEPTWPEVLKNGTLSRKANIDSTWEVYRHAIQERGLDPAQYEDMRLRLEGREETVFFQRHEHIIVTDPTILLADYIDTAKVVKTKRRQWEQGRARPLRSLSRDCNWCPYYRLCETVITGGDEEDIIRMRFTTGKEG